MSGFAEVFGREPVVSAHAPGRVNLLGEHTDYNDGYVLPTAIPQRTTVALGRNATTMFSVYSATLDRDSRFTRACAPADSFARYLRGCVLEVERLGVQVPALDIHVESQVPIGVGLSSSAALEVAMLRAMRALLELSIDDVRIAQLAQRAEVEYAGVRCGIMDQMASSLADTDSMLFLDTRSLERRLLPMPADTQLLVIDSGISRALAETAYNQRRRECELAAHELGVESLRDVEELASLARLPDVLRRRARHVLTENARVLRVLDGVDAAQLGQLMNASHSSLRDDYEVSVPQLDVLVAGLQATPGVHGARLTGAGFGGACVALCKSGMTGRIARSALDYYRQEGHSGRVLVPPQPPGRLP